MDPQMDGRQCVFCLRVSSCPMGPLHNGFLLRSVNSSLTVEISAELMVFAFSYYLIELGFSRKFLPELKWLNELYLYNCFLWILKNSANLC